MERGLWQMYISVLQKFYTPSSKRADWNGVDLSNFGNEWRAHKMILENLVLPNSKKVLRTKAQL